MEEEKLEGLKMALWQESKKNQQERRTMIEQAMKDQAPAMYRELEKAGSLKVVVRSREQAMMEQFGLDYERIMGEMARSDLPVLEKIQEHEARIRAAWETALANALEFQTTESA